MSSFKTGIEVDRVTRDIYKEQDVVGVELPSCNVIERSSYFTVTVAKSSS